MLAVVFLWYTYTSVSASLAILCTIVIISSVAAFLILRRCRRHRADCVLFQMGVRDIDVMDGIAFEHFLEALFKRLAYASEATQASGDYGVDVLLRKKKRRIAVQAKHYSSPVGLSAMQEVHAGMSYYEADEGSSWTSTAFKAELLDRGIELINARPYNPQTNGKLERFHRSLEEEVRHYESLSAYIEYYNEDRLHWSLDIDNYQTPLRAFSDKKATKAIREGNPN